eukprot:120660_1
MKPTILTNLCRILSIPEKANRKQTLSIELPNAVESSLNWSFDSPMFKQVNTLKIYANKTHGWAQQFLNQNIVNCECVTSLYCSSFGSLPDDLSDRMTGNEF